MKTEFHSGTLTQIATWLNYSSNNPPEGHSYATSNIQEYASGLIAQVMWVTPEEMKNMEQNSEEEDNAKYS